MILDHLSRGHAYNGLLAGFSDAIAFLQSADLASLPNGRLELIPNRLYANVDRTRGRGTAASPLEAHRCFADLQYVVSGVEKIGWRDIGSCHHPRGAYDADRDILFFDDSPITWLTVPAGYFAVFLPQDAHAPLAGEGDVFKIVMKIRIDG